MALRERYWRISYVPQIAVCLREPYRSDTRLGNLQGSQAGGDLSVQHQGQISQNAKRKMRNAILWLDAAAQWKWNYSKTKGTMFRWRLNFIHLTLPAQQGRTDQQIKKILNQFFLYANRHCGMKSYVWKAEPQERGEIHFHITSDTFIWKTDLQRLWNQCLRTAGLIGTKENPPSTRVHPTHNIKLMTAYLIKYMTKNDDGRRTITGRLWGCSRNLSQANNFHITMPESELSATTHDLFKESVRVDEYEWLTVFNLHPTYFEGLNECEVLRLYKQKIMSIRKGYAAEPVSFFDEKGKPMEYAEAKKVGLKPSDEMLYLQQAEKWFV